MVKNRLMLAHRIIHCPTSLGEWVGKRMSAAEYRAKRAVWSKQMNEQCEQTSEWMSEWPDVLTSRFYVFLSISFTPQNLTIILLCVFVWSRSHKGLRKTQQSQNCQCSNINVTITTQQATFRSKLSNLLVCQLPFFFCSHSHSDQSTIHTGKQLTILRDNHCHTTIPLQPPSPRASHGCFLPVSARGGFAPFAGEM